MGVEIESERKLRQKERRSYIDVSNFDDEIEGSRTFDVEEKLKSNSYNAQFVKEMKGKDITVRHFQENGFTTPMVVYDKEGLGMRVPDSDFTVEDVKKGVGSRRNIDVMDVTTQQALNMSMKKFVKYYRNQDRDRVYNVLSLEFSHSQLDSLVSQPQVVKQIDWVDTAWPRQRKERQTETTNIMQKMKYPKVQKYCLMSVKGCYTDFHIDMGGTSVWYHILRGAKTFWLIPPTQENLYLYEEWTLSMKQGDIFFADKVRQCQRITLKPGWTFFIPTGWIHAVHTPEDSLVFGGNFLHSFGIQKQLAIWDMENTTHVPMKFRYPFFTEIHWYVLERYVTTLTGVCHRVKYEEESNKNRDAIEEELNELGKTASQCHTLKCEMVARLPSQYSEESQSNDSCDIFSNSEQHSQNLETPNMQMNAINQMRLPNTINQSDNGIESALEKSSSIEPVFEKLQKCVINNSVSPLKANNSSLSTAEQNVETKTHLTKCELDGIRELVYFLDHLPESKRCVPEDIPHPDALLDRAKELIEEHEDDNEETAVTGEYTLKQSSPIRDRAQSAFKRKLAVSMCKKACARVGCGKCEPCVRGNKHTCINVRKRLPAGRGWTDGHAFATHHTTLPAVKRKRRSKSSELDAIQGLLQLLAGGEGEKRASVLDAKTTFATAKIPRLIPHGALNSALPREHDYSRKSFISPVLSKLVKCYVCHKKLRDDHGAWNENSVYDNRLKECSHCFRIVHPICFKNKFPKFTAEGIVNSDLPNSWQCPKCLQQRNRKRLHGSSVRSISDNNVVPKLRGEGWKQLKAKLEKCQPSSAPAIREIYGNVVVVKRVKIRHYPSECEGVEEMCRKKRRRSFSTGSNESGKDSSKENSPQNSPLKLSETLTPLKSYVLLERLQMSKVRRRMNLNAPSPSPERNEEDRGKSANSAPAVGSGPRPLHAEEQPPYADERPSHAEERPSHTEERPSHTEERPSHTEETPSHTDELPPHADERPSHTEERPSHTKELPPHADERPPQYADERPSTPTTPPPLLEKESPIRFYSSNGQPHSPVTPPDGSSAQMPPLTPHKRPSTPPPTLNTPPTPPPTPTLNAVTRTTGSPVTPIRSGYTSGSDLPRTVPLFDILRIETNAGNLAGRILENKLTNGISKLQDGVKEKGLISDCIAEDANEYQGAAKKRKIDESDAAKTSGREPPRERHLFSNFQLAAASLLTVKADDCSRQAASGQGSTEGQNNGQGSGEGSQNDNKSSGSAGGSGGGESSGVGGGGSGGGGACGDGGGDEGGGGDDGKKTPSDGTSGGGNKNESGSSGKKKKDASAGKIADLKPPKALVQKYAIRPAPIPPPPQKVKLENGEYHRLDQKAWMSVFKWLSQRSLLQCSEVCKTWHRWAMHHSLWQNMSFSNIHLTQSHLIAIVKRQPANLDLSWTNVSYRKLDWLVARLPHLKHLDLTGCSWAGVCALCSPSCPLLHSLNLSWVSGLISGCVRDLVSPPVEHRPGVDHSLSRLHHCHALNLSGSNITASALPVIAQNLPKLHTLRVDSCVKLTDECIETVAKTMTNIKVFSLSRCHGLTTGVLRFVKDMRCLETLEMQNCLKISNDALQDFARDSNGSFDPSTGVIVFVKREHSPMLM